MRQVFDGDVNVHLRVVFSVDNFPKFQKILCLSVILRYTDVNSHIGRKLSHGKSNLFGVFCIPSDLRAIRAQRGA